MQIRLYLDEDAMDSDLVRALRLRGVDVTTALDTGLINSTDEEKLEYATSDQLTGVNISAAILLSKRSAAEARLANSSAPTSWM